jgi:hypothetical protein
MLSIGEAYAAISGRSIVRRFFHRGAARRYDYGPTRTCGWSSWRIEAIFAGLRYQRSLEQLNFLDF